MSHATPPRSRRSARATRSRPAAQLLSAEELERAALAAPVDLRRARLHLRSAALQVACERNDAASRNLAHAIRILLARGRTRRAALAIEHLLRLRTQSARLDRELGFLALDAGLAGPGARLVSRAATTVHRRGSEREASELLDELETRLPELPAEAVAVLAEARFACGHAERGLQLIARAAEAWRRDGAPERAIELCRRGAELGACAAPGHRTWGLALLARGDDLAALPHLERWIDADPEDVDARIWYAEALFGAGRMREARFALADLARALGLARMGTLLPRELRARIEGRLAASGDPLAEGRLAPFWEADELVGPADESEPSEAPSTTVGSAHEGASSAGRRPRVLLVEDPFVFRMQLSEILAQASFDVVPAAGRSPAPATEEPPVDVIVLPVRPDDPDGLQRLGELRARFGAGEARVLGVAPLDRLGVDFEAIRALGVDGIIDESCIPEHVVFRVRQLARSPRERSTCERAAAHFPVDLEVAGTWSAEWAVDLGVGGMRVTSARVLEPNTDVRLRFRLPTQGDECIDLRARVIHRHPAREPGGPHEVGVFFYPLDAASQARLEREVRRLLAW